MNVRRAIAKSPFVRFALTGAAATLTHVAVFVLLVEALGVHPVAASVPAFLTALLASYYGHRIFTFRSTGRHSVELPKYTVAAVNGLLLNIAITYGVVDVLGAPYAAALALVVTIVPAVTFVISRKWVFAAHPRA